MVMGMLCLSILRVSVRGAIFHDASGGAGVLGARKSAQMYRFRMHRWRVRVSASVRAHRRTRDPFAVSGPRDRVAEVEFVFSTGPETIRRGSRECDLLRLVGKRQSSQPARWERPRGFSDCGFLPSDKTHCEVA